MSFTDQRVIDMLDSFYQPLTDELGEVREISEKDNIPLILRETESFLVVLLEILKPTRILEIGTAYGYSAALFASVLSDAKITTIERSEKMYNSAKKYLEKLNFTNKIKLLTGEASEILDNLIKERNLNSERKNEKGYDYIFIDAAKSHYLEFFQKAEQLANPGAVIVCDNILMHGYLTDVKADPRRRHRTSVKRMKEFLHYINEERKDLTVSLSSCGDGLATIKLHD